MSGEKKMETSQLSAPTMTPGSSIKLPEKDVGEDGIPSELISSVSTASNAPPATEGATDQASEQGVYYPPTSCYDYYYPRYNGNFAQSDDKGHYNTPSGSYADNASLLYYLPGYGSYGSEPFPCYTYDLSYAGNGSAAKSGSQRSVVGSSGSGNSNGFNVAKTSNNLSSRTSNPKNQQPHYWRSVHQNQSLNPLNKMDSGFQSPPGVMRVFRPAGNFSSSASRNTCSFPQYGPVNYQSNVRVWNNNYRSKSRENFGRNGESKALTELPRGPRGDNRNNSSKLPSEVAFGIERDNYNLQEFQTVYDSAKFYVIKSFSEDNIHKCIKYNVWSSTRNGNNKLDAAFREADAKTNEAGIRCPVFLFFSVNGSGQFVGVAEMIGSVDFSKNMDFWQLDKWNGFFPIKWHIIKDVPSMLLRHIILENNENRDVTHSRDTQEIQLKQGLEMLSIFKNYTAKTSIMDDFNFYENHEKALKAKRNNGLASQTNGFRDGDYKKHFEAGKSSQSDPSSLVSLTKNLSLDSQPLQE